MTLFNKSRSHYTAALLRNGGWIYYDGKFNSPKLTRWQTCYLNWKFNIFCILDFYIKVFLKWNSFLLYRAETIWCTFVSCTIRAPNMLLRGRNYLCNKAFLQESFCWKSSGNLILNPILTSWKVISYSWKKRIEAL